MGSWLKQIILVVLLASFVDLLLPNRSMQRYVKLVVSLFILITILSPVMNLVGSGMNLRMLAATVEGWDIGGTMDDKVLRQETLGIGTGADNRSRAIPALSEVLEEGEKLAKKRNEESLTLFKAKLESMVKQQVESQHGVAVKSADASLSLEKDGSPRLDRLHVVIASAPPSSASQSEAEGNPEAGLGSVQPVEPVDIRVQVGREPSSLPAFGEGKAASKAEAKKSKEVAESLARQWEVDASRVTVAFDGRGESGK